MLYYVLVYECVLVQMLSARSGVLSFNLSSNHLFPTTHMRSLLWFSKFLVISAMLSSDSNILCSFILMLPLGLRKSFALAPFTLQFV